MDRLVALAISRRYLMVGMFVAVIVGGLIGAAILIVVFNAVLMFGMPVQLQIIIKGLVIVLAAAFYVRRSV